MITGLLITAVVLVVSLLLSKLFPGRPPQTLKPVETLNKKRFNKLMSSALIFLIVLIPLVTFLLIVLSVFVQRLFLDSISDRGTYTIGVVWYVFIAPALFLSLLISGSVIEAAINSIGRVTIPNRKEWKVYMDNFELASAGGHSINQKKVFLLMAVFIIPLALLWTFMGIRNYAQFSSDGLYHRGFLSLKEKYYPYNQLTKINYQNTNPNGTYYELLLKDGSELNTLNLTVNKTPKEREVIDWVSQKSSIPITFVH